MSGVTGVSENQLENRLSLGDTFTPCLNVSYPKNNSNKRIKLITSKTGVV